MKLTSAPFHPFLFAIFPILFLFTNNFFKVPVEDLIIALVISASSAFALWYVLKRITKNGKKSGIITSLFLVLFFSYGHIFISANGVDVSGFDTSNHYHFVIPFIVVFSVISFLVVSTKRTLNNATKISNAISVILIIITAVNIGTLGVEGIINPGDESEILSLDVETGDLPDIYYMVFDSYGNHNTLKTQYNYDNEPFLEYLESRNFTIPSATHSNYPETLLSLPSVLNMQYIGNHNLTSIQDAREVRSDAQKIINNNEVMKKLKEKGYEIINFNSGAWITSSIQIADRHPCDSNFLNSEFIGMVIRTSMLNPLHVFFFEHDFRYVVNCIFENIPGLKDEYDQPVFVFAHVMIPHPPYVFGPDGETVDVESLSFTDGWDNKKGYLDQVKYANKRIPGVVDAILSDESPIIIIQSDHGPKDGVDFVNPTDEMYAQTFGILNAYHLPGCDDSIYDSISPINSFRVIFNCYFDEDYELLDDNAYWTSSNGNIIKVDLDF